MATTADTEVGMRVNSWDLWPLIRAAFSAATALALLSLAALLAGCGGGDDLAPEPPSSASATIGAAGGTLDGPDGSQVVTIHSRSPAARSPHGATRRPARWVAAAVRAARAS
jgi:hypothetical protein